jgi:hypothetical protein
MAQTVRQQQREPRTLRFLDTDGKPHPREDALAAVTLLLGAVASITSFWPDLYLLSSWTGLVGILTGARGQFVSVTTAERFVLVIGLGAAALGFFLGMARGGLFGGLIG